MAFSAKLLFGGVHAPAPNAPMIGHAHFAGGGGKWKGITGAAFLTGKQNGNGTASIEYRGVVYVRVQNQ